MFDVSSDEKRLSRHKKTIEDRKRLASEETHDALSREKFQKENLKRAGEGLDSGAVHYKKNILIGLQTQILTPHLVCV